MIFGQNYPFRNQRAVARSEDLDAKKSGKIVDGGGKAEADAVTVVATMAVYRLAGRCYHRRDFSVSGSNNVSGCRLYGVRPGTGECPVGSSDDARSPGATPVRTYISILTNHYYMPGEPRWAESTTNAHVAYLDQVYQQFTGARAL